MHHRYKIPIILFLISLSAVSYSESVLFADDGAKNKYTEVTNWLDSLKTFCVEYMSTRYILYHPDSDKDPSRPASITTVRYCYDGANRFVSELNDETGKWMQGSYLNGKFVEQRSYFRQNGDKEEWQHYTWDTTENSWNFVYPDSAYQSPLRVFGKITSLDEPLLHYLKEGEASLKNENERDILLFKHPSGINFEFSFDQQGYVENLSVYSIWLDEYDGDITKLRWPKYSYSYLDYVVIHDFLFPLNVTHTTYLVNPEGRELLQARNSGYMGAETAELEIMERGLFTESVVEYIQYDPKTIRINEQFEDEVFMIDIPENVRIMKRSEINAANVTESGADKSKWTTGQIIAIGIATLIGTLVVLGGIFWRYTQTRKIDPVAQ